MKRNTLIAAATAGLVAITTTAGSVAWAQSPPAANDAAELQQFVTDNPQLESVIADLEAQTGGKVTEAEFEDDMGDGTTHVEFEVTMADGSDEEHIYNIADGTMTLDVDDDDDNDEGGAETEMETEAEEATSGN